LGVALSEQKDFEQALFAFRTALRADPAYAEAHYNLGNTLGELDRGEEACLAFRDAIRQRPDYADALNNLGSRTDCVTASKLRWS
jgi:protein O-GlcNAc transferase